MPMIARTFQHQKGSSSIVKLFVNTLKLFLQQGRCSIVVSIPACHAGDPGSIPGNGGFVFSKEVILFDLLFLFQKII